jgi:tetratricopeptide (TPR) repeat protein
LNSVPVEQRHQKMESKRRRSKVFLFLEVLTVAIAVTLYLGVYRPKERLEAEWDQTVKRGQADLDQGNFFQARQEFQISLDLAEKRHMGEIEIASSESRIADADRGLRHYDEAIRLDERARPVFERHLPRWEGAYFAFLAKLAATYQEVGRYSEAETAYNQALLGQERAFGPKNLALTDTLNAMAYFYYDREQDDKAMSLAERSLAICQSNLGPKHPRTAWALSIMSLAYDGKGKFPEAERAAREALPILETAYGSESFEVASTLNRLGLALEGLGRLVESEASFRRGLAIREARMGPDWEGLLPILHNLSRVCGKQGKQGDAAALQQRAEDIAARHLKTQES